MAQVLFQDKIGTLSHSVGILSLTGSRLTIGGQQYITTTALSRTITTDVTLTLQNLYYIYAIRNAGNTELRVSINPNSIGPSGFTSWKLVGAFYTDTTAAFSTFVNKTGGDTIATFTKLTGSGTYNTPTNALAIKIRMVGGGGNGATSTAGNSSSGGGAGGYCEKIILNPSTTYSYVVGGAATATTFSGGAVSLIANGGATGIVGSAAGGSAGGTGGTASGGDINIIGGSGSSNLGTSAGTYYMAGSGGASAFGGGGYGGGTNVGVGQGGQPPGSGGGGGGNGGAGGAGAAGTIIIEEIKPNLEQLKDL
jgi:hypothetical protein